MNHDEMKVWTGVLFAIKNDEETAERLLWTVYEIGQRTFLDLIATRLDALATEFGDSPWTRRIKDEAKEIRSLKR